MPIRREAGGVLIATTTSHLTHHGGPLVATVTARTTTHPTQTRLRTPLLQLLLLGIISPWLTRHDPATASGCACHHQTITSEVATWGGAPTYSHHAPHRRPPRRTHCNASLRHHRRPEFTYFALRLPRGSCASPGHPPWKLRSALSAPSNGPKPLWKSPWPVFDNHTPTTAHGSTPSKRVCPPRRIQTSAQHSPNAAPTWRPWQLDWTSSNAGRPPRTPPRRDPPLPPADTPPPMRTPGTPPPPTPSGRTPRCSASLPQRTFPERQ